MKKILTMLLCSLTLFSPLYVRADNKVGLNECNGNCIAEITEDYVDPTWISVANGNLNQMIQPYAATKTLFVDKYYQDDYPNDIMQTCGLTIKAAGCALTSVTMVANFINGTALTPAQVNKKLGTAACPIYFDVAASKLGITKRIAKSSGLTTSYLNSEIVTQLNNNVPVIIGMEYSNGGTHFVVVKGYSLSGSTYTFNINDPAKVGGKTTLNAYLSAGAKITQLVVYD